MTFLQGPFVPSIESIVHVARRFLGQRLQTNDEWLLLVGLSGVAAVRWRQERRAFDPGGAMLGARGIRVPSAIECFLSLNQNRGLQTAKHANSTNGKGHEPTRLFIQWVNPSLVGTMQTETTNEPSAAKPQPQEARQYPKDQSQRSRHLGRAGEIRAVATWPPAAAGALHTTALQ